MTTSQTSNFVDDGYRILAAVAFDETGDVALREAAHVAERHTDSELHVAHIVREDRPVESSDELVSLSQRLEHAPAELGARIERCWEERPRQVIAHVRSGDPAKEILQAAVDIDADLIVLGSHQRRALERFMLGSVAEQVLREAHCPVLIALPKDYRGTNKSRSIEPPCPDCIAVRRDSKQRSYWCERHSRVHPALHVYEPSQQPGSKTPSAIP